jgi:exonuclease SbcC
MKFKRVTIQNFLSYKQKQTLEFTGKGISLLLGKNGEGKSAIASAIYFALFGKSDRGKLDNLVNFDIGKNCLVELEFEKSNKSYKIIRGLKPSKFEIYANNKKLEDGLVKERQARLNEILGFNETIFYQLIYLGTNTKNFLDLNKKERENFINVILDIDEINLLIENAKNYLKHLKTQKEILESKINYISFDIEKIKDEHNAKKEEVLKEIEEINKKLSKKDKVIQKINQIDLSSLQNEINQKEQLLYHLKQKVKSYSYTICPKCGHKIEPFDFDEVQNKIKIIEQELISLKTDLQQKQQEKNKFQNALSKLEQLEIKKQYLLEKIKDIDISDKEIELKKLQNEFNSVEKEFIETKDLIKILEEIKEKYFGNIIPLFNKFINHYLEELNLNIKFQFKNNFDINISPVPFESLSNGQKMRITIAILFTLLKIIELKSGTQFNILFLDEFINGSLDINGVEDTLNALKYFANKKEIILITHNNDIKQMDEIFARMFEVKNGKILKIDIK